MINCEQLLQEWGPPCLSLFAPQKTDELLTAERVTVFVSPVTFCGFLYSRKSSRFDCWFEFQRILLVENTHLKTLCHSKDSRRGKGAIDCGTKPSSSNKAIHKWQRRLMNAAASYFVIIFWELHFVSLELVLFKEDEDHWKSNYKYQP